MILLSISKHSSTHSFVAILDLAQRIKIAKLILEGKTYDEIAQKVKTSTSTVSKIGQIIEAFTKLKSRRSLVRRRIKYGKGGLQKVLEKNL